jgi:enoyl-CoA hydratase
MTELLDLRTDDGVATITLQHGKVNALCVELLAEIEEVAGRLAADASVGAVVITGGRRIFAAGADITQFAADTNPASFALADGGRVREVGGAFLRALGAVAALPMPTIAAINGVALGGGCELALACDFRIVAADARFGQPEILLGIIPGGGGTQRLARLVGPAVAKDLVFTGRTIDAAEATRVGLADRVVEPDDVSAAARAWAADLARGPRRAIALAKRAIDAGLDRSIDDGLALEQDAFVEVFATRDATTGVQSFLEHGPGKAVFGG